jgi:hypothetical protein
MVVAIGLAVTLITFKTANQAEERRVVKMLEFRVAWRASDLEFARGYAVVDNKGPSIIQIDY